MRRRLFAVVSAVSLLLCLASVGLWVRSYYLRHYLNDNWLGDYALITLKNGRVWEFWSSSGALQFETATGWKHPTIFQFNRYGSSGWSFTTLGESENSSEHSLLGIYWKCEDTGLRLERSSGTINPVDQQQDWFWAWKPVRLRTISVPYWMLFAVGMVAPLMCCLGFLRRFRRRRLSHRGRCERCAYDLTGNTSGVCPECGTPVPKEPTDKSPRPA